jgi:hypothetical protein
MNITQHLKPATTEAEPEASDGNDAVDNAFDLAAFDAAMEKWRGFLREQILADGFTTTEELMNEIRGR